MTDVIVTIRKWGNSIGFVLPKNIAEAEKLKPDDEVIVHIERVSKIKDLFGTLKFKQPAQKIKDELRIGWDD